MALIKCNECGNAISDRATQCPYCGCPVGQIVYQPRQEMQTPYNYQTTNNSKSNTWLYVTVAVLATLLITLGIWAATSGLFSSKDKTGSQELAKVQETETPANSTVVPQPANNGPKKLRVTNAEYYYSLAPQSGNTYEARNMLDGRKSTAWAVSLDDGRAPINSQGGLDGPVFTLSCKKLSYIIIRNGYHKNSNSYINNTRAAGIDFYNCDVPGNDILYSGPLKDTQTAQRLDVASNLPANNNIRHIGMRFNWGYNIGARWNDLCASEVEFWGYE